MSDEITGAPLAGAAVSAYASDGTLVATATTSVTGVWRLVLPPGQYRFVAFDPQFLYAPGYVDGAASFDTSALLTIATDSEVKTDIALRRGTLVRGSAVDESGNAASGIEVTALDMDGHRVASATTVADGSFQLALIPGTYKFVGVDPNGRFTIVFYGGATFADAAVVTVDATGAQRVVIVLHRQVRRRAARH